MIVLFTSNTNGGVIQLIIQLLTTIDGLGREVRCFIPEGAIASVPKKLESKVVYYMKVKSINRFDSRIRELAGMILKLEPELIWYVDDTILSHQMVCTIRGKSRQMLTMHDAGNLHPTNNIGIKKLLHNEYAKSVRKKGIEAVNFILVLSEESRKTCERNFPTVRNKIFVMTLGAHVPAVSEEKPQELLNSIDGYFLFFGRIDKYKGIMNMVSAYKRALSVSIPLVIAGNGIFSADEKEGIESDGRIISINRYISDGEMIWLFRHARIVVLPYIEATQSGIIPIAYKYGVPVITSDISGLTQFVEDGKTGFICRNRMDYVEALVNATDDNRRRIMSKNCEEYSKSFLDWENNVQMLLSRLGIF